MSGEPPVLAQERHGFAKVRETSQLPQAVVRFHRRVDDVVRATLAGHGAAAACERGCAHCCHLPVDVLPPEAFALAEWLRARMAPALVAQVARRAQANAERTAALGREGRKRVNLACALLGVDGACMAYEARPAQCRRHHSLSVDPCARSHADPADEAIESGAHGYASHNAAVLFEAAARALQDLSLDATKVDLNLALAQSLRDGKAWRRWRDGKKAFPEPSGPVPAAQR